MLDFTSTTRPSPSARALLSGQTIAKAKTWSPRDRAERAVDWMLGHPIEHPTTPQAAAVFGASTSMIAVVLKERAQYGCPPPLPPLDALWAALDSAGRAAFIMRNESAIWKAIDRITA